jgi:membrane-associated PAP2 superfamily phosphatase
MPAPGPAARWRWIGATIVLGLAVLVALEFSTVDLDLARLAYDPVARAFPLRDHWLTTTVSHDGAKLVATIAFAWILVGVWSPVGPLARLASPARVQLLVSVIACLVVVASLKRASALHCPWGLVPFGGSHAYLRLFEPVPADWSRGGCFPAGHVASAFAFVGGWFAFRDIEPAIARRWLVAALLAGAWIGLTQQLRGAHFLSHTLWTLWICWSLSAALAWLAARLRSVKATAGPAG